MSKDVPPPSEPEIELLGRIARRALLGIRGALLLAGIASLVYGALRSWPGEAEAVRPSAHGAVWLAVAVPLLLPTERMFAVGAASAAAIAASLILWFAPMAFADDHAYGFVLRMFATLVAVLTMLVWRTLWRLGRVDH